MTLIADHPFNDDSFRTGSERAGPDLLVRTASGEFQYVEVKWWIMVDDAIERAKKQASSDFRAHREYEGIRVAGAFAIVLDWDTGKVARLHIVDAKSEE